MDFNTSGSSTCLASSCYFGDVGTAVLNGTNQMRIVSCGQETQSVTSSRFVSGGTSGRPCATLIEGCYSVISCPSDDYGVQVVGGDVTLRGNMLCNLRVDSATFKVQAIATPFTASDSLASQRGSVRSYGNWYSGCTPGRATAAWYAPLYDSSDNHMLESEYGCRTGGQLVTSEDDWQFYYVSGAPDDTRKPTYLQPTRGLPPATRRNAVAQDAAVTGTIIRSGQTGRANTVIELDYLTLAAYGAVMTANPQISKLYARWRLVSAVMEVVTPFAGTSLTTFTLSVGTAATTYNNILVAADATATTGTDYGLADADLGTKLARATAVQGGYLASTSVDTAVYAQALNSVNMSVLTAGKVRIYLTHEATD